MNTEEGAQEETPSTLDIGNAILYNMHGIDIFFLYQHYTNAIENFFSMFKSKLQNPEV